MESVLLLSIGSLNSLSEITVLLILFCFGFHECYTDQASRHPQIPCILLYYCKRIGYVPLKSGFPGSLSILSENAWN
jgi:hypothetical protein